MAIAVFVARVGVGGLLLATGALKVGHSPELAAAIAGFRLVPAAVAGTMAVALPWVELLLGLYLIAGLLTKAAAWFAAGQFLVYAGAIASAVIRHIPAYCGCFGPQDSATADWPHVAFDLGMALIAACIAINAPGALAVDRRFQKAS